MCTVSDITELQVYNTIHCVIVNDVYCKVNYPPYFFEADLLHPVDQHESTTTIQDGYINIQLCKHSEFKQEWSKLCYEGTDILERREESVKRQQETFSREKQVQKEEKHRMEQEMVQKLLFAEQEERRMVQELKDREREMADGELKSWISSTGLKSGSNGEPNNDKRPPPRSYGQVLVQFTPMPAAGNAVLADMPARDKTACKAGDSFAA